MTLIVIVALQMPVLGARFSPSGSAVQARVGASAPVALSGDTPVIFSDGSERLRTTAAELAPDYAPSGSSAAIAHWYQERTQLAAMAATGRLRADFTAAGSARSIPLTMGRRGLFDLSLDVWLLLGQGFVIGLLGVTVFVLRPDDIGGRIFAVSCGGVLIAAFSGALFDARELTANGDLLRWAQGFNFVGSNLCGAGVVALFLWQPRRLLGKAGPTLLLLAAVISGVISGLGWAPLSFFYGGLAALSVCFLGAMVVQWMRTAGDPVARSILRWVGVTAFIGSSVLTIAMAAPQLLGIASIGGDGLSFLPLFVVYGGIAFGVVQFRLFDLDAWAIRLAIGALGALALLAADALLIWAMGVAGPAALAISVLLIGFLYFPARRYLWRLVDGRPPITDIDLFQSASDVAFTRDPQARRLAWRQLLQQLFDPVEIDVAIHSGAPALSDRGLALILPSAADETALILRYRARGRKLFDRAQVALAIELIRLMRRAEQTREEYARGALEERQRIARDLHDDVSARLLTSLHRDDLGLIRSDLRKVMSDIRTMVSP